MTGRRWPCRTALGLVLAAAACVTAAPADAAPRPITAAFYYAWYPETWTPPPHAVPALGHYHSTAPALIRAHLRLLREAHVDAAIVSWWGRSTTSDSRLRRLMRTATALRSPLRFAIYHEGEGQGDPSVASLAADIAHVRALAKSPRYLRVGGKPVIFAFADGGDACGMASRWRRAARGHVYVVLKVFPGYQACADQPSAWHQYAPDRPQVVVPGQSISISPGFYKAGEASARLARDPRRFRASVRAMNASRVRWHLITTFNEWGEGTAVEPARSWQRAYISALARRGREALGVASLSVAAGDRSALVSAGVGTGSPGRPVFARVEWGATNAYGHVSTWRLVRPALGPRLLQFRVDGLAAGSLSHVRVVVRRGSLRKLSADRVVDLRVVHVAAAGDIACGAGSPGASCSQAVTAGLVQSGGYAGVLALGDLQYENGALADFQSFYDASWGAFKSTTHPAPGNHEYNTANAAGYYTYFGPRAGAASRGYYSFRIGAWHLIALNSNCARVGGCGPGSPQETWLRADLSAHRGSCTLAYWHHPRFSSGGHGDQLQVDPLWQALADAHADVVLAGHDHDYERFGPVDGIRSFVVGTGGRNLTGFKKTPDRHSEVRLLKFGVLDLALRDGGYSWRFLAAPGGATLDSGTASCR